MPNMHPTPTALATVFLIFTWILVSIRCYVKALMVRSFGWDDIFMLLALIFNTLFAMCLYLMAYYGIGYHTDDQPPENVFKTLKWFFFCEIFYDWTSAFVKTSIGLFLLRIVVKKAQIWAIRITMLITTLYVIALFFIVLFQCMPPSFFWDKNQDGTCLPTQVITNGAYTHSAVLAAGDFIFAGLPAWLLWNAKMSRTKKIAVASILALGSVGGVASLVRFQYINQLNLTNDFLYDANAVVYWSYIESSTAIMAGSLVTFRPLFRSFADKIKSSRKSNSGPAGGSERPTGPTKKKMDRDAILLGTFGTTHQGTVVERLESETNSMKEEVPRYGSQEQLRTQIVRSTDVVIQDGGLVPPGKYPSHLVTPFEPRHHE